MSTSPHDHSHCRIHPLHQELRQSNDTANRIDAAILAVSAAMKRAAEALPMRAEALGNMQWATLQ